MSQVVMNNQVQGKPFLLVIRKVVSKITTVPEEDIDIETRKREIVQARQICMFFAKSMTKVSLASIGEEFGGKDHATVLHANRTVKNLKETDRKYRGMCYQIQEELDKLAVNPYDDMLVCKNCGGTNIETKAWMNPNTNALVSEMESDCEDDNWCNDCQEHYEFITRKEFLEAKEEAEIQIEEAKML